MKKILIYLVIGGICWAGCGKDLDQKPLSSATTATFYTSDHDFIQGVNAIYGNLKSYPDRLLNLSETRSDNLYAVSDGGVRDWEGVNSFHRTLASNVYVSEAWSTDFNGIFNANVLLDQLVANGNVISNEELKTRLEAEAKFLRAFYYFDLVRYFGKIPVSDHALSAAEALSIPRSPREEAYQLILSDLQFAVDHLPENYSGSDLGRATKYAAEGLLALVYMTRSGPTLDIEGPGLGANEWSLALPLLNDIIQSGRFKFLPTYPEIFSYSNENNAEVVFDIQYTSGFNPVLGATFPWVLVPDRYFESIGKERQGGVTIRPVSNDLLNSYGESDARRTFSVEPGFVFNGVVEDQSFFKKYLDISKVPSNRVDWPINFIVLRYTDVLLLKAECVLHGAGGSPVTDVDEVVNQVRRRAGLAPLSQVSLSQLLEERRREFAAEGSRWHDLVRFGEVESKMTAWIAAEDVLGQIQPFDKNYIIYPIPQSELDVKPGLYEQNPGY